MSLSRRNLLAAVGATSATAALASATSARRFDSAADDPLYSISLAQWSLHRTLRSGQINNLDFAATAKDEFGIEAVEYVNQFFMNRAADFDYLGEMKLRAADAGVQSLLIMIDGEGSLAHENDADRRRAIVNHFKWIAAARFLGCHAIRVNAAGGGEREAAAARAADSLRRLAVMGDDYDINVIVENHGGMSSDGSWLASVMRQADHPRVGTLPDFGNFHIGGGREYDRYLGVEELMPFAKAVSAKSHDFDAEGNETHTDYRRMMQLVVDAGYTGFVGVEYEGGTHSEYEGIRLTKALLERVRAELSAG